MDQKDVNLSKHSSRFYAVLGLSICPATLLVAALVSAALGLDHQMYRKAAGIAGWIGLIVGYWSIYRWLFMTHKPSNERALLCGVFFFAYLVWFGFWGVVFIGLAD